jgi:type IV pilus assembly protein PilY1
MIDHPRIHAMNAPLPSDRRSRRALNVATFLVTMAACGALAPAFAAPPTVGISQLPLTIALPANPQVVFAVTNSQSMDGNLSGAIMTGSGSLGSNFTLFANNGVTPVNYAIPAGFTPPLNTGDGVNAPYTVTSGSTLYDNSPSRLNVAKQGMQAVLTQFMANADFSLATYTTSGVSKYTTWVYMMSPTGANFSFTALPGVSRYVNNPCYNYNPSGADTASVNCKALDTFFNGQDIKDQPYMVIGASSDDPAVNDVLYAGGLSGACVVYGALSPPTPYPPNYTLANYNSGGVTDTYASQLNSCARTVGPTNAGFVPYSPQTMYVERGFGYYGGQSANNGTIAVPMTSAGAIPTTASVATALAKFTPFLAPETNSTGTGEVKSSAVQSPTAGLLTGIKNYYVNTNPPSSNGCSPTRNVVLLTDGLPTEDLSGKLWPPAGSAAATGYGMTVAFNADGSLNVAATNDQALKDAITVLGQLKSAGIKTYIVGLGAGVDPTLNPVAAQTLTAMAIAAGTGAYFPATSPTALAADLQVILSKILTQTQSTASAAVNSTGLRSGAVVYQSQFVTSDANQDWTGELYAFPINPSTGVVNTSPAAALWSAKTQLDLENWDTGRIIATWDPVAAAGTPFRWNPALAPAGISATTALGAALQTFTADPNGQDALQFLRGRNAQELRFGGQFRNRTHKLGDIVDSNPVYVGLSQGASQDPTYFAFAAATVSRPAVVYVGANDGMLHAFDALTGAERFAYVPNGIWGKLIKLVNPYYNAQHQFYANGSAAAADVRFTDGTWHTVLASGEAAGGQSVFALDVTDPASIISESALASKVLWEFTDGNMGDTFSQPQIANTNAGWMVFFGNGYNSPTGTPFLYALDPKTGAVKAKLDLCSKVPGVCNAGLANGLSTATVVNSSGSLAQPANIVYAGDLQGNVWKVNIATSDPTTWTVQVILQARDPGGNVQPITTAPAVSLNPRFPAVLGTMVMVGTGQLLSVTDFGNTQTQTVYGVFDPPAGYGTPLTRATLVQQTLQGASIGTQLVRVVTGNAVSIPSQKGWFVDLTLLGGERIVTDPRMESGGVLVLSTYQPNTNSCTGGGNSYLMMLNYANGGYFPAPQFDANADGQLGTGDSVTSPPAGFGANPIGLSLGAVYASGAVIMGGTPTSGTQSYFKVITKSDTTSQTVMERGSNRRRTAWWEVR